MKSKKWRGLLTAVLFLALSVSACGKEEESGKASSENAQTEESVEESGENIFGEFKAETLDGEDVTQEIFGQSKLTMINIWGTFCGPCIQEMPDLGEISRSYDRGEFQVIGLISDVTETGDSKAQEIVQSAQADYMHLVASPDIQQKVLSRVSVVPTTIFVDSEGNQVGEGYAGSRSKEEWTSIIEDLRSEVQ